MYSYHKNQTKSEQSNSCRESGIFSLETFDLKKIVFSRSGMVLRRKSSATFSRFRLSRRFFYRNPEQRSRPGIGPGVGKGRLGPVREFSVWTGMSPSRVSPLPTPALDYLAALGPGKIPGFVSRDRNVQPPIFTRDLYHLRRSCRFKYLLTRP